MLQATNLQVRAAHRVLMLDANAVITLPVEQVIRRHVARSAHNRAPAALHDRILKWKTLQDLLL